jgi:hypothetical protein
VPKALKVKAIVIFGFACVFLWAFMFFKHNPRLRNAIPFGEDPYDAIGSFGVIAAVLIAMESLFRAFRPYGKDRASHSQKLFLIRSQQAVVLAAFITFGADAIAMVRHPAMWAGTAAASRLAGLLAGVVIVAVAVQWMVRTGREGVSKAESRGGKRAATTILLAVLILALYPERWMGNTATHLLTIVVGDCILFGTMRVLLAVLVPEQEGGQPCGMAARSTRWPSGTQRWGIAVILGATIGLCAFLAEMRDGAGVLPPERLKFVACVFVGLGLSGLLIAYAFLAQPLGLGPQADGMRARPDGLE